MKARFPIRHSWLAVLGLLIAALHLTTPSVLAAEKLNFLFILVDDLGWSDLGCYGADLHETPNIDRFATQSTRFTDAYAAAPVCSPTRASIMTGKFPARLHMTIWYEGALQSVLNRRMIPPTPTANLPHAEVTLAEALKTAGYLTAHVGKWHLGDAGHYPETQGFDLNIGGTFWGAPPTYFYPYRGKWANTEEIRYVPHLEGGKEEEYLTDRLTDEALKIMASAKDRPLFLNLWYHTVHTPIEGKPALVQEYTRKVKASLHHRNPGYAAMVRTLDDNVGRLLAALDQHGIAGRTVVFLTSDNGGFINNYQRQPVTDNYPLRSGKGSLYEGGLRVPMIVRWPGVTRAGTVCRTPVLSTDYYPTILEMAGRKGDASQKATVDGLSLVPLLRDPNARLKRDALFFHYPHYYQTTSPVSAVRAGDWKLLEYHEDKRVELYDLKNDLSEAHDLATTMPDKAEELRRQLHAWRETVGAQMPTVNPNFKPNPGKGKKK